MIKVSKKPRRILNKKTAIGQAIVAGMELQSWDEVAEGPAMLLEVIDSVASPTTDKRAF